jgi:hypothetical protein
LKFRLLAIPSFSDGMQIYFAFLTAGGARKFFALRWNVALAEEAEKVFGPQLQEWDVAELIHHEQIATFELRFQAQDLPFLLSFQICVHESRGGEELHAVLERIASPRPCNSGRWARSSRRVMPGVGSLRSTETTASA